MKNRLVLTCLVTSLLANAHERLYAVGTAGFGNEVLSARALGQGAVGVAAQNDDPSVTYGNPAGLINLSGTKITFGATWESVHGSYQSNTGNRTQTRLNDVMVPNAAVGGTFKDGKVGLGLSLESPYGLETHWGADSPLRYLATNSRLAMVFVSPAVAYRVNRMFSVGAGADYVNVFDATLEKQANVDNMNTALGVPTSGSPDATSSLKGKGTNWGYHAGVLFEPNGHHAFGLTYHSKILVKVNGSVTLTGLSGATAAVFGGSRYTTSAFTTLVLPQNIQFGYAFKPNDRWTFEADTAWYDWSAFRDLNIQYDETNATRLALLTNSGAGNPILENWRNALGFATGANYKHSDRLQLRGGVWYQPYVVPESTFSPAFNDLTRYGLGLGVGIDVTQHVTLDLAETLVLFGSRVINNNTGTTSTGDPTANPGGTFRNFANLFAANVTYKF